MPTLSSYGIIYATWYTRAYQKLPQPRLVGFWKVLEKHDEGIPAGKAWFAGGTTCSNTSEPKIRHSCILGPYDARIIFRLAGRYRDLEPLAVRSVLRRYEVVGIRDVPIE